MLNHTPALALEHARAIHAALVARRDSASADFNAGLAALEADLTALGDSLGAAVGDPAATTVLGSHPVYEYLASASGLDVRSLHLEPDVELTSGDWHDIEHLVETDRPTVMLWEAEPLPGTREGLAERGIAVAVYDPASAFDSADWLEVMRANVATLAEALGR